MATTPRVKIPYPDASQQPFYDKFVSTVNALDSTLFAGREDRNIVMMRGGVLTFTASSGVFTWASDIEFFSPISGNKLQILAGNATILNNQALYVTLVRNPTQTSTTLVKTVASLIPNEPQADDLCLVAYRYLDRLYFRNGKTLNDGDSLALFELTGSSVPVTAPTFFTVTTSTYTALTTDQYLIVHAPIGGTTLTLPTIGITAGKSYNVVDDSGNAATRNTTITPVNAGTYIISLNWGSAVATWNGTRYNIF